METKDNNLKIFHCNVKSLIQILPNLKKIIIGKGFKI
jgi:hypothetical protein